MNIIFGEATKHVPNSYTMLQLDTFRIANRTQLITSWCVLEQISLAEFPMLEHKKKLHNDLMQQYCCRNWDFCLAAIKSLMGSWNCEVDSFYEEIENRIFRLIQLPPAADWDGCLIR